MGNGGVVLSPSTLAAPVAIAVGGLFSIGKPPGQVAAH
jgi:hypothetical protein